MLGFAERDCEVEEFVATHNICKLRVVPRVLFCEVLEELIHIRTCTRLKRLLEPRSRFGDS